VCFVLPKAGVPLLFHERYEERLEGLLFGNCNSQVACSARSTSKSRRADPRHRETACKFSSKFFRRVTLLVKYSQSNTLRPYPGGTFAHNRNSLNTLQTKSPREGGGGGVPHTLYPTLHLQFLTLNLFQNLLGIQRLPRKVIQTVSQRCEADHTDPIFMQRVG
jgi:hypothetical protein